LTVFAAIAVPEELRAATDGKAWLEGMLAAERALALAEASAGVIPAEAADAIAEACRAELFDLELLAKEGRAVGNPVEPLVRALREAVGGDDAQYVHRGATSQDILDSAAMLVAKNALALVLDDLDRVAAACARHAREHRDTPMAGRTLLQQAVPTTFGLKAAGWLVGAVEARSALRRLASDRLAAQLGGAAGTNAALGKLGPAVVSLYASELGLLEPTLPWHSIRVRVAELGSALAIAAGVTAKIGLDVALLAQTEVAEVAPPPGGGSSTMPQKRNPVGSALAVACARLAGADASVLVSGLVQEHERAVGGWHAEWDALSGALAYTGGAAAAAADLLEELTVDVDRMRANIDDSALSERAVYEFGLTREQLADRPLRGALADALPGDEIDAALDPAGYLGSAGSSVDRALALYEAESTIIDDE
jgi:3-carboxy-cis,cis-muconate cycloisomerase